MDGHTTFHSQAWCRTLCETYRYKPLYLCEGPPEAPAFILPLVEVRSILTGRRGVSLPFTDACSPLGDSATHSRNAFKAAAALGRKRGWRYMEFRTGGMAGAEKRAWCVFLEHHIPLSDDQDEMFTRLSSGTRRGIRKAEREGVEVKIETSLEAVRTFYHLNCLTRREHGLPPQPFKFFATLHRHNLLKGQGIVATAYHRGEAAASSLFLSFGKSTLFKYGASNRRFQHVRPSNLVMWQAICWYAQRGFTSLCLGRTAVHNEGLLRFKRGWGATETELPYFRYDLKYSAYLTAPRNNSTMSNAIFRKVPLPLSRLAGALLYRHAA
jgi:hypothetical protein